MKIFKYLSWLLVAMTLSIGLAACSNDDDDDDVSGGKSELVGKWEMEEGGWGYRFDADGKGFGFEQPYGEEPEFWDITWRYNNNLLIITDVSNEYQRAGYSEVFHITYMDEDIIMFYYDGDEDNNQILYKVRKFSWE